jgi:hypothetical protein
MSTLFDGETKTPLVVSHPFPSCSFSAPNSTLSTDDLDQEHDLRALWMQRRRELLTLQLTVSVDGPIDPKDPRAAQILQLQASLEVLTKTLSLLQSPVITAHPPASLYASSSSSTVFPTSTPGTPDAAPNTVSLLTPAVHVADPLSNSPNSSSPVLSSPSPSPSSQSVSSVAVAPISATASPVSLVNHSLVYPAVGVSSATAIPLSVPSAAMHAVVKQQKHLREVFQSVHTPIAFPWLTSSVFDMTKFLLTTHAALVNSPLIEEQFVLFLQYRWETSAAAYIAENKSLSDTAKLRLADLSSWFNSMVDKSSSTVMTWAGFVDACKDRFPSASTATAYSNPHVMWQSCRFAGRDHPDDFIAAYLQAVRNTYQLKYGAPLTEQRYQHCWQTLHAQLSSAAAHNDDWRALYGGELRRAYALAYHSGAVSHATFDAFLFEPSLEIIRVAAHDAFARHVCGDKCGKADVVPAGTSQSRNRYRSSAAAKPADASITEGSSSSSASSPSSTPSTTDGGQERRGTRTTTFYGTPRQGLVPLASHSERVAQVNAWPSIKCHSCHRFGHAQVNCPTPASSTAAVSHATAGSSAHT